MADAPDYTTVPELQQRLSNVPTVADVSVAIDAAQATTHVYDCGFMSLPPLVCNRCGGDPTGDCCPVPEHVCDSCGRAEPCRHCDTDQ